MTGVDEKRGMTCIICPRGCEMTLMGDENGRWLVSGNECEKGLDYAMEEVTAPKRVLTTTVALEGARLRLLPVRSSAPLPKESLFECMKIISERAARAPVRMGDVIIGDIMKLGVDIIATRDVMQ